MKFTLQFHQYSNGDYFISFFSDIEAPTFDNCNDTKLVVPQYSTLDDLGEDDVIPAVSDNTGIRRVTSDWPMKAVISRDFLITWTAEDHAGNMASCAIPVKVIGNVQTLKFD